MKRGKHPTDSRKNRKKKIKETYAKAREEAQLADVIPTEPVGAVRDERVHPATQSDGMHSTTIALTNQALREGWGVDPKNAARYVEIIGKIIDDPNVSLKEKINAFNALGRADQRQYERDHPELLERLRAQFNQQFNVNNSNTNVNTVQNGEVFDDITKLETSIGHIIQPTGDRETEVLQDQEHTNSKATSGLREDRNEEPLDVAQPNTSQEEPKAD